MQQYSKKNFSQQSLSHSFYAQKFLNALILFLKIHHPKLALVSTPQHTTRAPFSIGLAVSGGIDSMALLWAAGQLKKLFPHLHFSVLHLNHQTRPEENNHEQQLVKVAALNAQFSCHLLDLDATLWQNGFQEQKARELRYAFFQKIAQAEGLKEIWTAHHLDDSWEWSQMQMAKSGSLKGSLGIPLRKGKFFRPFMCVTKKQITRLAFKEKISYLTDSSNSDLAFERNWWRATIETPIFKKYPKTLKHYVARQNALSCNLNTHIIPYPHLKAIAHGPHSLFIAAPSKNYHFWNHRELIHLCIIQLSGKNRGQLSHEIRKLCLASMNGKKGPMNFSGGVSIKIYPEGLLIEKNLPAQTSSVDFKVTR